MKLVGCGSVVQNHDVTDHRGRKLNDVVRVRYCNGYEPGALNDGAGRGPVGRGGAGHVLRIQEVDPVPDAFEEGQSGDAGTGSGRGWEIGWRDGGIEGFGHGEF